MLNMRHRRELELPMFLEISNYSGFLILSPE
jgi:hypothetical protein